MNWVKILLFLLCVLFGCCEAKSPFEPTKNLPVLYQGRFRSLDSAAQQWLYELSHKRTYRGIPALDIVWDIELNGDQVWRDAQLFWVHYAQTKTTLGLDLKRDRFSYNELTEAIQKYRITETQDPEIAALVQRLNQFSKEGGWQMRMLPSKHKPGEWLPLHDLSKMNTTSFSDREFSILRSAYSTLSTNAQKQSPNLESTATTFATDYLEAYSPLENTPYRKASGKALLYPSKNQLALETFYHRTPMIELTIAIYALALLCFFWSRKLGWTFLFLGFALHTFTLCARSYILSRPPVSNMFETVIYVPWITIAVSMIVAWRLKTLTVAYAGCIGAIFLLTLLKLSNLDAKMENVQAVLDSQFWLIIHVLMVVGSYGAFIISGILGHFYLIKSIRKATTPTELKTLSQGILTTLFVGVSLLIPGTLLGGIWAAESWGRFWDWDPKESWAFISACVYVIVIHAYTFKKIEQVGLAVGSILGLVAISFTWYGVNYILGTGMHSYGFSQGTPIYYFTYLIAEFLFLFILLGLKRIHRVEYH